MVVSHHRTTPAERGRSISRKEVRASSNSLHSDLTKNKNVGPDATFASLLPELGCPTLRC